MDNILNFAAKVNGAEDVLGTICGQNAREYGYFALFLGCGIGLTMKPPRYAAQTRRNNRGQSPLFLQGNPSLKLGISQGVAKARFSRARRGLSPPAHSGNRRLAPHISGAHYRRSASMRARRRGLSGERRRLASSSPSCSTLHSGHSRNAWYVQSQPYSPNTEMQSLR